MIFLPLLIAIPVVALILFKEENIILKINKNRAVTVFFLILLLLPTTGMSIPKAEATNTIKQIIKIEDIYDADNSFQDYVIHPPLSNTEKTFVFISFSHTGEEDHADTFRSWEIIDNSTLRIKGEDTATDNEALEFIAYVIEYEGDMTVQHLSRTTVADETEGEKSVTIPTAINTTNSFIVSKGHHHNASETTIASEELDRIRIIDSTNWGWLVFDTPNTGDQGNLVDVIDWNQDDIFVQRGLATLSDGSSTTTISPPTDVNRTRTMLLVTYACGTGCATTESVDDTMLSATLDASSPPDIVVTRDGTEDDMQIAWELVEFPEDFVKVHHDTVTISGGSTTETETVPEVRDFDKTFVIGTVATPFGWGTGSITSTVDGAIDRAMVDMQLWSQNEVNFERGDSTDTAIIGYQVIELLEPEFAQNPDGQNFLRQVVKLEGSFDAGNVFQDYTIDPPLVNLNKTMVFMSMNSTFLDGSSENGKLWQIVNETTFRIIGSGDATNDPADFNVQFVEFNATSPIFVQFDQLQFPEDLDTAKKTMWISPVNTTNSFILGQGSVMGDGDPTFGSEEFASVRLENETSWSYEPQVIQDDPETVYRAMITDFGHGHVMVQRGNATMNSTTTQLVITPDTAIDRERTLLFVNFRTVDGEFGEFPNRTALSATLDSSDDIVIERESGGIELFINYQLVTGQEHEWAIQHGIHHQDQGQGNTTETINSVGNVTTAFAIGTVASYYSLSMGRGNSTAENNFDTVYGMMDMENDTTLRFLRGDTSGSWDMGYQVVEFFFTEAGLETVVSLSDNSTATDDLNFGINMTEDDISSAVDFAINFDVFKELGDIAIVNDTVVLQVSMDFITNQTDVVIAEDSIFLNITKVMDDMTQGNDNVTVTKLETILINASTNTVEALDNVALFVSTVPPTPPPSGGGSPFQPPESQQGVPLSPVRLIGIDVDSELLHIQPSTELSSEFLIKWFGLAQEDVRITNITPVDEYSEYSDWFQYTVPELLDVSTTEGYENRLPTDPRSNLNQALNDFRLIAPRNSCIGELRDVVTSQCLNPILYEIPLRFEFNVKGATFSHVHTVQIDARLPDQCDFLCQLQLFLMDNWLIISILIGLFMLIMMIGFKRKRQPKIVHIIRSRDIDQLGNFKNSRKFKKFRRK